MAIETGPQLEIRTTAGRRVSTLAGIVDLPPAPIDQSISGESSSIEAQKKPIIGKKTKIAGGLAGISMLTLGGGAYWAHENPDQAVKISRSVIGEELTFVLEQKSLYLQDQYDRLKFKVLGGEVSPYEDRGMNPALVVSASAPNEELSLQVDVPIEVAVVPEPPKPVPLFIPETSLLQKPAEGEGIWTTEGLPRTSPEDTLMVKTFLRPDPARPYARVDIMLVDKRRIKLNIVGGTIQPGIERGVKGPGVIPE